MIGLPVFAFVFPLYLHSSVASVSDAMLIIPEPSASPPASSPVPPPPGWERASRPASKSNRGTRAGGSNHYDRSSRPRWGGFGGVTVRPTAIGSDFGLLLGGGGGLTFGRYFFGGAGYTLMASTARPKWGSSFDLNLALGVDPGGPRPQTPLKSQLNLEYGGMFFGVSAARFGRIELAGKLFAGFGHACVELEDTYRCHISTPILVAEPEFVVYFNLARAFRLGVSAGYRFVMTFDWPGPRHFELGGPSGSLLLEFGWF